ncbi:hypothetical protein ABNC90_08725 [Paenibacillus larvae]|nr:hypothetical protein [Paenibacillus larvae]MDT2239910.1 hypothetical protein [Paenibacillus larvae]MDT2246545.1 hypothetical protein [Paenibacillus larvae]MDT2256703.1 hypothetical protein [Paenibacillus larvae]MDT2259080.1 hypothetical protein [Paenibacillus larvae]MDT2263154.1 hypothetical protein [Paenibacillus larvae]
MSGTGYAPLRYIACGVTLARADIGALALVGRRLPAGCRRPLGGMRLIDRIRVKLLRQHSTWLRLLVLSMTLV